MADNKKSFVLYADLIHTVEHLSSEQAGDLFKHILEYVNDKEPISDNIIIQLAFEPIKRQLKRDLEKFIEVKFDRSKSGKLGNLKRWNKDLYDKVVNQKISLTDAINIANSRKASQSDKNIANVAVNDTVNVNDNVNDINNIYNIFVDEVKKGEHDSAIEQMYMRLRLKKGSLTPLLKTFKGQLIIDNTLHKNSLEVRKHFNNWLNMQERVGKLDEYKKRT